MWNGEKSISLSKFSVMFFVILLIGTAITAPMLVHWYVGFSRAGLKGTESFFLVTIYLGCVPAFILLFCLYQLLHRIEKGQVFIPQNVECLRRISWSSIAGGMICFISAMYYFPWMFVAIAAAFMGLIVRVVKNIVEQAVELKNESDFTI